MNKTLQLNDQKGLKSRTTALHNNKIIIKYLSTFQMTTLLK